MLNRLAVNNFALIDNVQLDVEPGFTVITGETGSGKSILLGALRLILGERADYSVIRDQHKKTVVEATFTVDDTAFSEFFDTYDLDFDSETVIRREINAKGKSRAFINDSPVQLAVLKLLTERLINIHSQHHTLALKNKDFQRSILDVVADHSNNLKKYEELFSNSKRWRKEIQSLEENKAKLAMEFEFNTFQLDELKQLELDTLDYEKIEEEVKRGEQFEEIKAIYQLIAHTINDDEGVLNALNNILRSGGVNDSKIEKLLERIKSVNIELKDISAIAEDDLSDLSLEPDQLSRYTQQLDAFNSALRKHNLTSQKELVELYNSLTKDVDDSGQIETKIAEKKEELEAKNAKAMVLAKQISKQRKAAAKKVKKEVVDLLEDLKLEGATIDFDFEEVAMNDHGIDEITMYFAPNKGIEPQIIEKSASGGELSRLMLVIDFILSRKRRLPTVIFDEIDTGVSGEVAQRIGRLLKKMGTNMQLMAITHLPQVASKGSHHTLVTKDDKGGRTKTFLRNLGEKERIEEIAKLMSGSKINDAALINAKNLMYEE